MRAWSCLSAIFLMAQAPVLAAELADPTRPPSASALQSGQGGARQLQLLLSDERRSFAMIDGQLVGLGDAVGDGKVLALQADQAVIATARGRQTLSLYPDLRLQTRALPKVTSTGAAVAARKPIGPKGSP